MAKQLAQHTLVVLLAVFTLAGSAGLVLWHNQGLRFYAMPDNSLAPQLQRGDLLTVAINKTPARGDIINIADPDHPRQVITKRLDKGPVPGNLVGVTVKAVPLAGYFLDWLRRPAGLAIFIYVPAFMVCRAELKRLSRHFGRQAYQMAAFAPVSSQPAV